MRVVRWMPNLLIAGMLAAWCPARAQRAGVPVPVSVRGVAFDGLRNQPLRNAIITLSGDGRNATTDSRGRFQFDSVTPGVHTFSAHHAMLDSLGFAGLTTRTTITDGQAEVRIAVPTFAALWHAACGAGGPPADSGFVYGTERDARTHRPVANADVEASWTQMVMVGRQHVMQRRWQTETHSDSTGSYSVCGVIAGEWLQVHAAIDSSQSGWINLPPNDLRVQRRDLMIGASAVTDTARTGMIVGVVTDPLGGLFADARIRVDGAPEVRSDANGHFVIRRAAAGTREVEVLAAGIVPTLTVVDVVERDTTSVVLRIGNPVVLEGMRTVAARSGHVLAAEFAERRRSGAGYSMDSLAVGNFRTVYDALASIPSTSVLYASGLLGIRMPSPRGGSCVPVIRIDGLEAGTGHLIDLRPDEVAGMEVYLRPLTIPAQFVPPYTDAPECGMILVWTKYGFKVR